jgi:hypothetical protein
MPAQLRREQTPMPIPDERLPQADELIDESSNSMDSARQQPMVEEDADELEFETADVDTNEELIENDDAVDRDTASFGFGDPAD